MSGLLFLQTEDFSIQQGQKGPILCHSIRGISLVLFYSINCQYSRELIPIFKRMPGQLGGCQFAMINVSAQKHIIGMSKATIRRKMNVNPDHFNIRFHNAFFTFTFLGTVVSSMLIFNLAQN